MHDKTTRNFVRRRRRKKNLNRIERNANLLQKEIEKRENALVIVGRLILIYSLVEERKRALNVN